MTEKKEREMAAAAKIAEEKARYAAKAAAAELLKQKENDLAKAEKLAKEAEEKIIS